MIKLPADTDKSLVRKCTYEPYIIYTTRSRIGKKNFCDKAARKGKWERSHVPPVSVTTVFDLNDPVSSKADCNLRPLALILQVPMGVHRR